MPTQRKHDSAEFKARVTPREAIQSLTTFFGRYNERRQHQSLDYQTPAAVYFGTGESHIILS